jgi:hypothetical protein
MFVAEVCPSMLGIAEAEVMLIVKFGTTIELSLASATACESDFATVVSPIPACRRAA